MTNRYYLSAAAGALCLFLSACDADPISTALTASDVAGTYQFVSLTATESIFGSGPVTIRAGEELIIPFSEGDIDVTVRVTMTGTLTLTASGRYAMRMTTTATMDGSPDGPETDVEEDSGAFSVTDGRIDISSEDPEVDGDYDNMTITLDGGRLTMSEGGDSIVWQR